LDGLVGIKTVRGILLKRSVLLWVFCGQKDSMQRIFIKKYFLFTVGSVSLVKWFTAVPEQVRKWLRQQPKDLYAAGFDALVKRWDKCINVGGGYVEK
jgi:hypothetical protein